MRLSVALCTYNGSKHVREQLESIAQQTRPPDELIICDDASGDDTVAIARDFRGRVPFAVRVETSQQNRGSTKNFERAISLASGDVVVLADQDDVWCPGKLEELERAFVEGPAVAYVFSDAIVVDEDLTPIGHRLWDAVCFGPAEQRRARDGAMPSLLLKYNVVTGATMAFRAEYRELLLPIPPRWVHDGWIALLLSLVAPCTFIEKPLIRYRQHSAQQLGGRITTLAEKIASARKQDRAHLRGLAIDYAAVLRRARTLGERGLDPKWPRALEQKVRHCLARSRMRAPRSRRPLSTRLPLILSEALRGRYGRYSLGWKSIAQDLFLIASSDRSLPPHQGADDDPVVDGHEGIADRLEHEALDARVVEAQA